MYNAAMGSRDFPMQIQNYDIYAREAMTKSISPLKKIPFKNNFESKDMYQKKNKNEPFLSSAYS